MFRSGSIQSHLTLRDKIFSLDLTLFVSILILGIISFFAMYSTDAGEFAKVGVDAVSLIAMDTTFQSGFNPYHTRDDHTKNIDPRAVQASFEIAQNLACNLDSNN